MSTSAHDPSRITIFGLGLIGASVALAAKARWPRIEITAIDQRAVLDTPQAQACADHWVPHEVVAERQRAFAQADLTLLAAPLHALEGILPEALVHCSAVTDCGSTKRSVAAIAAQHTHQAHFVGGHPMAGKPTGGIALADAQLFVGRTWILCPEGAAPSALDTVEQFVRGLGAVVAHLDAAEHDRLAALTSHVPQLLASALLVLAGRQGVPKTARGPGFESATRVAGGSSNIWRDILERNGDQIAHSLDTLIAELQQAAQGLREQPIQVSTALDLLAQARRLRDSE